MTSVVVKYREDQARDDHGRFADEGGGEHYTAAQQQQLRDLMGSTSRQQAAGTLPKGVRSDAKLDGEAVPVEDLKSFVSMMAQNYPPERSAPAFILKYGQEFQSPDAPPNIKIMTPKACYENSTKMSKAMYADLEYAEGYVMLPGLPLAIGHAWNVDKAGKVVDHTLGWSPKAAYFGVQVPENKLREEIVSSGTYGALDKSYGPSELVKHWIPK